VQYWTSPADVSSIQVDLQGASGGVDYYWSDSLSLTGGLGGRVRTTLSVLPNTLYAIYIGGIGGSRSTGGVIGCAGGFNGGGNSGTNGGAGGGGGSDIRTVSSDLTSRLIVAGGGGGASHFCYGKGRYYCFRASILYLMLNYRRISWWMGW
jgi:hypothetical protein